MKLNLHNVRKQIKKFQLNKQVFQRNYLKTLFCWIFFGTLCYQIIIAILPSIFDSEWYNKSIYRVLLSIYNHLNTNSLLNFLISIFFFFMAGGIILRLHKNKYFSIGNVVASIIIFKIANLSVWQYSKIIFIQWKDNPASFFWIISLLTCGVIIVELIKLLPNRKESIDYRTKGFTDELTNKPESYSVRGGYAQEISNMLSRTNLIDESYSVAIVGKWGSGKTTFIEVMKQKLNGRMYIKDFNPWNSISPQDIISDFFSMLQCTIKSIYSSLEAPIKRYSQLLTNVEINKTLSNFLAEFSKEDGIQQIKQKIEKDLKYIDKPIAIFIDDIDRLGEKELFEVLRLVRNTAKFPNILYVVTMDKDYVSQQLEARGMDGDLYLEKIFPLEISLPRMDDQEILLTMRNDMLAMTTTKRQINKVYDKLDDETKQKILRIITTFRKAKRFARQFAVTCNYLTSEHSLNNIDFNDLFFLELIHFYDRKIYDKLANERSKFFRIRIDRRHCRLRYVIDDGIVSPIKDVRGNITSEAYIKDELIKFFLERIFDKWNNCNGNSLQLVDNYLRYFSLSVPTDRLTDESFDSMLAMTQNDRYRTIHNWCYGRKYPILAESILSHFMNFRIEQISTIQEIQNFIDAVFMWLNIEDRDIEENYYILPLICYKIRYRKVVRDEAKAYITRKLTEMPQESQHYLRTTKILANLLWYRDINESPYLTDNNLIIECQRRNFSNLINSSNYDNVLLIKNDGNIVNSVAVASATPISYNGNKLPYSNLMSEMMVDELAKKQKSKNKDVAMKLYYDFTSKGSANQELKEFVSKIFGKDSSTLLEKYVDTCFEDKDAAE